MIGRRRQRRCMHHDPQTAESFVRSRLIDLGRRKLWWCDRCKQVWL